MQQKVWGHHHTSIKVQKWPDDPEKKNIYIYRAHTRVKVTTKFLAYIINILIR